MGGARDLASKVILADSDVLLHKLRQVEMVCNKKFAIIDYKPDLVFLM